MTGSDPADSARPPGTTGSSRVHVRLVTILLVALALRLWMALTWSPALGGDEVDYHRLGISVSQGAGIVDETGAPSSFRPPAYPALVGAVYRLGGVHPTAVRVAQAVAGTLTVLLVFLLGRALLGSVVGLVSAALVALDAGQIAIAGRLLSEGVFTTVLMALVLLSVGLVTRLRQGRPAGGWAAATGAIGAVGALLRGILLPYPLFAAAALALEGRVPRGRRFRAAAVVVVAWGAVLAPWTVRNAVRQHAFVPVTSQVGITFYSAQNPPEGRLFGILAQDSTVASVRGRPEPEKSRALLSAGLRSLWDDPARIPRLELMKALFFVVPFDWEVFPRYGVVNPSYAFLLFWAVAAWGISIRRHRKRGGDRVSGGGAAPPQGGIGARWRTHWPLWLPGLFFFAMALVFYGSPRLRLPVEPLLAVPAAWALTCVGAKLGTFRALVVGVLTALPALGAFLLGDHFKGAVRALLRAAGLWG